MLELRWRNAATANWKRESLGRRLDRDARGKPTSGAEAAAVAAAQEKSLALASGTTTATATRHAALTIGETEAVIIDKDTGKYPHRSQSRDELVRAIRFAVALWGTNTPWEKITDGHWTTLLRRRVEGLVAKGARAVRATEITISRLITVVRWLQKKKLIPREAALWPDEYKKEIAAYWQGVTNSSRPPQPYRPRHTLEEGQRILAASGFDPRWELLMWLGMELRLGQVARGRRSDLKLPEIDWAAWDAMTPDERETMSLGTYQVHGAGKKGGAIVAMTAGQRRRVDRALAEGGYLADVETRFKAGVIEDYRLFPAGYVIGRVGRSRGKETVLRLGSVDYQVNVTGSWIRKSFRTAEALAGIEHVAGRCAYGVRRQSVDTGKNDGLMPGALKALGGWSDIKMPENIYADGQNEVGQMQARSTRARIRGEDQ